MSANDMVEAERALRDEIKKLIVTTLRFENVDPKEIEDEQPLFAENAKLKIDSLGALELLSAIEYAYQIEFEADDSARKHFASVATLAAFVMSKKG